MTRYAGFLGCTQLARKTGRQEALHDNLLGRKLLSISILLTLFSFLLSLVKK